LAEQLKANQWRENSVQSVKLVLRSEGSFALRSWATKPAEQGASLLRRVASDPSAQAHRAHTVGAQLTTPAELAGVTDHLLARG